MSLSFMEIAKRVTAWQKANPVHGRDPNEWRVDAYGNLIRFDDHGDRSSPYGWEIDHIVPRARGGDDWLTNTRALHWRANVRKADR
jgi:hypothetical protein